MRPFRNHHPFIVLAVWVVCLHGCSPALIPFDEHVPAQVLSYIGAPPVVDARARFRAIFCELFNRNRQHLGLTGGCDDCLWRLYCF